jgi:hypothetical protein
MKNCIFVEIKDSKNLINNNSGYIVLKGRNKEEYKVVQLIKQKNQLSMTMQNVSNTRIRKGEDSVYITSPSREIKKWFQSRKFEHLN